MQVKDFSKEIVDAAKSDSSYQFLSDSLGVCLGGATVLTEVIFTPYQSLDPIYHASGATCSAASWMFRKMSGKFVEPVLREKFSDPRFTQYGLDEHYETYESLTFNDLKPKQIDRYDVVESPIKAISTFLNDFRKHPEDLFSTAYSCLYKSVKLLSSKMRKHRNLSTAIEPSLFTAGTIFPPFGHGAMVTSVIEHVSKTSKAKEIKKALEIGSHVDEMITNGLTEDEVRRYLKSLIKPS